MNMYKSWSRDDMSEIQKEMYQIEAVGESVHTGRTTFKVTCNACGKVLHERTNNPSNYFKDHEAVCPGPILKLLRVTK